MATSSEGKKKSLSESRSSHGDPSGVLEAMSSRNRAELAPLPPTSARVAHSRPSRYSSRNRRQAQEVMPATSANPYSQHDSNIRKARAAAQSASSAKQAAEMAQKASSGKPAAARGVASAEAASKHGVKGSERGGSPEQGRGSASARSSEAFPSIVKPKVAQAAADKAGAQGEDREADAAALLAQFDVRMNTFSKPETVSPARARWRKAVALLKQRRKQQQASKPSNPIVALIRHLKKIRGEDGNGQSSALGNLLEDGPPMEVATPRKRNRGRGGGGWTGMFNMPTWKQDEPKSTSSDLQKTGKPPAAAHKSGAAQDATPKGSHRPKTPGAFWASPAPPASAPVDPAWTQMPPLESARSDVQLVGTTSGLEYMTAMMPESDQGNLAAGNPGPAAADADAGAPGGGDDATAAGPSGGGEAQTGSLAAKAEAFKGASIMMLTRLGKLAAKWRNKTANHALPALSPFIPNLLKQNILERVPSYMPSANNALDGTPNKLLEEGLTPRMHSFQGAVMVADITGFTKLTEALGRRGTGGVELLTKCMNQFFGKVVDLVLAYDGDVMKFAGDAMICTFYPTPEEVQESDDDGLLAATRRCVYCAYDLARNLGHMRMQPSGDVVPVSHEEWLLTQEVQAAPPPEPAPAADVEKSRAGNFLSSNFLVGAFAVRAAKLKGLAHEAADDAAGDDGNGPGPPVKRGTRDTNSLGASGGANAVASAAGAGADPGARVSSFSSKWKRSSQQQQPAGGGGGAGGAGIGEVAAKPSLRGGFGKMLSRPNKTVVPAPRAPDGPPKVLASAWAIEDGQLDVKHAVGATPQVAPVAAAVAEADESAAMKPRTALVSDDGPQAEAIETHGRNSSATSSINSRDGVEARRTKDRKSSASLLAGGSDNSLGARLQKRSSGHKPAPEPRDSSTGTPSQQWRPFGSRRSLREGEIDPGRTSSATSLLQPQETKKKSMIRLITHGLGMIWNHPKDQQRVEDAASANGIDQEPSSEYEDTKSRGSNLVSGPVGTSSSQGLARASGNRNAVPSASAPPAPAASSDNLLSLKMIVGAGTVCVFHCGGNVETEYDKSNADGVIQRWEFFIGDRPHAKRLDDDQRRQPIAQIAEVEGNAAAGEVVISGEVLMLIDKECEVESFPDGACRVISLQEKLDVVKENISIRRQNANKEAAASNAGEGVDPWVKKLWRLPFKMQNRAAKMLRMHVMDNVRQRVEAGHLEFINEIRQLTVLFMGFPYLAEAASAEAGTLGLPVHESVQYAVDLVQERMKEFRGTMLQFRCDEKGFLAICAFGLPGKNHHDNPARGMAAALSITDTMMSAGRRAVVGVTTGDLLCACVGSPTRLEYTVFGDAINLSARLMCKAKAGLGQVLCDGTTHRNARKVCQYDMLEPLAVKGKAKPVNCYKASSLNQELAAAWLGKTMRIEREQQSAQHKLLIGRDHLLNGIQDAVAELIKYKRGKLYIVQGEPGMGKSVLLEHLAERMDPTMRTSLFGVFLSAGSGAHKSQALYPWRRVFLQMFELDQKDASNSGSLNASEIEPEMEAAAGSVTRLARRLAVTVPDWDSMRRGLAEYLKIPEASLPELPATVMKRLEAQQQVINQEGSRESASVSGGGSGCGGGGGGGSGGADHASEQSLLQLQPPDADAPAGDPASPSEGAASMKQAAGCGTLNRQSRRTGTWKKGKTEASEVDGQVVMQLLSKVLRNFVSLYGPVVILLDDLHLFDTQSWELLTSLTEMIGSGIMLVTTLRPNDGCLNRDLSRVAGKEAVYQKSMDCLEQLYAVPHMQRIELTPLKLVDVQQMMEKMLPDVEIKQSDVQVVMTKSGGLPMYVEQMAMYLSQKMQNDGEETMNLSEFIKVSGGIHHVIMDRVDRLRPTEQLTLKVCSVMGSIVSLKLLSQIYPVQNRGSNRVDPNELQKDLMALQDNKFLKELDPEAKVWQFSTIIQRDTVYDMIPHIQRRNLHARLAEVLEAEPAGSVPLTTIAFNWTQACNTVEVTEHHACIRAIELWDMAAQEARSKAAYAEALHIFRKAADMGAVLANHYRSHIRPKQMRNHKVDEDDDFPVVDDLTLAEWEQQMSMLCVMMNQLEQEEQKREDNVHVALSHAFKALYHLGVPMPGSTYYARGRLRSLARCLSSSCCCCCDTVPSIVPGEQVMVKDTMQQGANLSITSPPGRRTRWDAVKDSNQRDPMSFTEEEVNFISTVLADMMGAAMQADPVDVDTLQYIRFACHHIEGQSIAEWSPIYPISARCGLEITLAQRAARFARNSFSSTHSQRPASGSIRAGRAQDNSTGRNKALSGRKGKASGALDGSDAAAGDDIRQQESESNHQAEQEAGKTEGEGPQSSAEANDTKKVRFGNVRMGQVVPE